MDELDVLPSFATVKLKSVMDAEHVPFSDQKGYILKNKLLQFFQSLLDSFLDENELDYPGLVTVNKFNYF